MPAYPTSRLAIAAGAAALALTLTACGDDDVPTDGDALAPVTASTALPSSTPSADDTPSATATPSGTVATSSPSPSASASWTPGATGRTVLDDRSELEIEDQSGDGRGVRVQQVELTRGSGHVAIFGLDGRLLGSAPVTAGSQPVTIPMDTPLTASGELLAVLFADDGDGQFDPEVDPRIIDKDGEVEDEDFDYRVG